MSLGSLNRRVEAEAAIDQALALVPDYSNALRLKIGHFLYFQGDTAKAVAILEKVPAKDLLDARWAVTASDVWMLVGSPEKCITALSPAPDYIETSFFTGPKAHLIALAHRRAGRLAAAQAGWASALRVVEQRLTANPNHRVDLRWQATLLALLDRRAEAERVLQVYNELGQQQQEVTFNQIPAYVALGRHDEVISFLEKLVLQAGNSSQSRINLRWFHQWLRHHPEMDTVRDHPRFQALLQSLPPESKR